MPKYNNILLVDDNEVNNMLHGRLLEISEFGKEIVVKQSAQEGLDFLNSVAGDDTKIPEVIFLDIRMPVMDGFGFLDEFEKMPFKAKSKVVLLSSTLDPEDSQKAAKYPSVIKMILKPLSIDQLESL